jgi:divalent metal cation (Fe/Co/Zn/Cd) transporter
MRDVAMTHAGVVAVDYVRTRRIGPRYWVDVRLQVAADMDVAEADAIGRNVRVDLMQRCEDFQYVEVFVVPAGARPRERHRLHVIQPTEHA